MKVESIWRTDRHKPLVTWEPISTEDRDCVPNARLPQQWSLSEVSPICVSGYIVIGPA
jgi:hypothetical protein